MLGRTPLVYTAGQWEIDTVRRELRTRGAPVPVGSRTFDIIEALVQSAGELVTKDELMAKVWPGAVIGDNTLQVHIHAIRKALGADRAMLKTVSGRGYRLLGDWAIRSYDPVDGIADRPDFTAEALPKTNLPLVTADLIGRSQPRSLLRALATAYRSVTLTGPGGIGKSVLAIEVARDLLAEFGDGGWLVELAALSDPALVPSATAEVLGLRLGNAAISADSVARAIGRGRILVVLDNCEHLIDAAAELVETIVRQCPNATVIATSREALRIDGEYVYRVPPLDIPAATHETARHLLELSSVALFIAKTRALNADFVPDQSSLPAIAAICRHLDGIPLAIEFAAARAAALGVQQVAGSLRDRFSLLTTGRRTALPRHRTLRATLDWSYELLPDAERLLLRHLAVFPGGFSLEAAAAVVPHAAPDTSALAEGVARLVEKSLVVRDRSEAAGRWHLLETIRAYALEKLAGHDEIGAAMRRHAVHFRDRFDCTPPPPQENLEAHVRELDNVRAALDWCFSPMGDEAVGVALTAAYAPVWLHLSLARECIARCERAIAGLRRDPAAADARHRMQLLAGYALAILFARGTGPETIGAWNEVLRIAEDVADTEFQLRASWGLFVEHLTQGDCEAALNSAERYQAVAVTTDRADVLIGERMIATALHHLGRQPEARSHVEEFLRDWPPRSAGDGASLGPPHRNVLRFPFDQQVTARSIYARILWLQGCPDQASRAVGEAIGVAETTDQPMSLFFALFQAACPLALLGADIPVADSLVRRLLELADRYAMEPWKIVGRCYMGMLLTRTSADKIDGIRMVRAALSELPESAFQINYAQILAALADALARSGEVDEAMATIDAAMASCERRREGWYVPELIRVRGELLIRRGGEQARQQAADHFRRAIDMAARQGALSWELRAATSLARLQSGSDRPSDGRDILASVYGRFTEGFDTADLRAARAVLDARPD